MEGWIDGRRGVCVHYIQINVRMEGCVCTLYTDEWKDGWMEGRVCVHYIQMNGRMDGWMEGRVCVHYIQMNGRMDGWKDGCVCV